MQTDKKACLVMMHEQDPAKGGCEFRHFITATPDVLLKQYRVFDTLAVPLYPSPEHRAISIRHGLCSLGAKQQKQSFFARLSGEARSRAASVSEASPGPAATDETELGQWVGAIALVQQKHQAQME